MKVYHLAGVLCLALPLSAQAALFSVRAEAFGYADGRLFYGSGEGYLDGTGSLSVQSQPEGDISCTGTFSHDFRKGGQGHMSCSNGEEADFNFILTGPTSGYGEGQSRSHGPVRFSFGLDAEEAAPRLGLPAGSRIEAQGEDHYVLRLPKAPAGSVIPTTVSVPKASSAAVPMPTTAHPP